MVTLERVPEQRNCDNSRPGVDDLEGPLELCRSVKLQRGYLILGWLQER